MMRKKKCSKLKIVTRKFYNKQTNKKKEGSQTTIEAVTYIAGADEAKDVIDDELNIAVSRTGDRQMRRKTQKLKKRNK